MHTTSDNILDGIQNGSHHVKEHEKLCPRMMSETVCSSVCGHLSLSKDVPPKWFFCVLLPWQKQIICPKWLSVEIIQKCRNRFAFLQFSPRYSIVNGCWCYVVVSPKRRPSKNQKSKTVSNEDLDLTFPHFLVNHRLPRLWGLKSNIISTRKKAWKYWKRIFPTTW